MATVPGGELKKAAQLLRAKQTELYIQAVRDALQREQQRKLKLNTVTTHLESKRLEKRFAKERTRERERLRQLQEDHALLLRAKITEWKVNGVPYDDGSTQLQSQRAGAPSGRSCDGSKMSPPRKVSKAALSRLATPRVTTSKGVGDGKGCPGHSFALPASLRYLLYW